MSTSAPPAARWRNALVRYGEAPPDQLLAHPGNPKLHPKAQQQALGAAISELGWLAPVVVNERTQHVLDGHARIGLAISRGEPSVPVVYVDLPAEQEALALATFDPIGGLATHDRDALDALLVDVETGNDELRAFLSEFARGQGLDYGAPPVVEVPEPELDRAAELQAKWGTARGQLWEGGRHRVMCGDSTDAGDAAGLMGGEFAALLLTDPPYNLGIAYGGAVDDAKARDEYEAFSRGWLQLWRRVSARQIVTPGWNNLASWQSWFAPRFVAPWTKTNSMTRGVVSQWTCWEPIVFLGDGWPRRRPNEVFDAPISDQRATGIGSLTPFHPCPKPLNLWIDLLENYSDAGAIAADPFAGIGTTLCAAEQLGRRGFGMEIEPKYVAVTLERLAGMGLAPRLVESGNLSQSAKVAP